MTVTSHAHHIPGTPTESVFAQPLNCGGPGVCESCTFEMRWFADRDKHRALIFPGEVTGLNLDSQILRKISAKLRDQNPPPNVLMRTSRYTLAASIYALADAIDGVADDLRVSDS